MTSKIKELKQSNKKEYNLKNRPKDRIGVLCLQNARKNNFSMS